MDQGLERREGRSMKSDAAIDRERVKEAYIGTTLTISRLRSDAEYDLIPYYEGRRDALLALLEPQDVETHG